MHQRLTASSGSPADSTDLALYRPVTVSSTDYAATAAEFAVDGLAEVGLRGSGWRALRGAPDPQWIKVDLQAPCHITGVRLAFEAQVGDVPFTAMASRLSTTGFEILSSYPVAFVVEVSSDDDRWTTVYETASGGGGAVDIPLGPAVTARWVRLTANRQANINPLGLNGLQVYGTALADRPEATGWTDFPARAGFVPAPLAVAADGTVPIESDWVLTMDDWADSADGAVLSSPEADQAAWLAAIVPGTVLASLVEQNLLPDPVSGMNNLHIPEALSRRSWWYRRPFAIPPELHAGAGRRIWLEFDGINHQADIWLNGTSVGTQVHPFGRGAWDVTPALHPSGEQILAVKISPIPQPGSPGDIAPSGRSSAEADLIANSPTLLAASGWDWMPAVRDRASGIWDHVRLRSTGDIVVGDVRVDTILPNLPVTDTALVKITVPVHNAAASARQTVVHASFDDIAVSTTVTVPAGATAQVVFAPADFPQLRLTDPELWWPNGYGEPNLHTMIVAGAVADVISDTRIVTFGIRQIQYEYDQPVRMQHGRVWETFTFPRMHARYVRMLGQTRATLEGYSLWTFSVLDGTVPDGPDLARGKTATCSTDDGNIAANTVDGNQWTHWSSGRSDDQWLQVDLGQACWFDTVTLEWEDVYCSTYKIQVSGDGIHWSDAAVADDFFRRLHPLKGRGTQTLPLGTQQARYIRMLGQTRNTDWGFSLWEFAVTHASAPEVDLALRKAATSSSTDGNPAACAVDGDPHTRWSSDYSDDQWLQIDLGTVTAFDEVSLTWETARAASFKIQASDDGAVWTDIAAGRATDKPLTFVVNGVPVFARGGNWGWDELLRRMPPERMDAAVAMHRDMNFTILRNWIGSSYRKELFDACDRYGILVWTDFWNTHSRNPGNHSAYLAQAADTVTRYRAHPSVAVWAGCNEGRTPQALDEALAVIVAENTDQLYLTNTRGYPITGDGPYRWVDPAGYFTARRATAGYGFWSEIGLPTIPVAETMRNLVGDGDPGWPIGAAWYLHNWSSQGNQAPQIYEAAIDARLGASSSLDEFCTKAQFINYESMRAIFEAWNTHLWNDATGVLLWMSHPGWYTTVWQTYDYDLEVNGSYYGARKGCEAHHVQADLNSWQVTAVNHTPIPLPGVTVTATLYDVNGDSLAPPQELRLDVEASGTTRAFTVPFADSLPDLHLMRLAMADSTGTQLSENTYWRYRTDTAMQALNQLGSTLLAVSLVPTDTKTFRATITNKGGTVAPMVRLSLLRGSNSADRVLPTLYSDNYFWLLPGESRTVIIEPLQAVADPRLQVSAYNAPPIFDMSEEAALEADLIAGSVKG